MLMTAVTEINEMVNLSPEPRVSLKVIEEKERELVECIAQNYSKLKGKSF